MARPPAVCRFRAERATKAPAPAPPSAVRSVGGRREPGAAQDEVGVGHVRPGEPGAGVAAWVVDVERLVHAAGAGVGGLQRRQVAAAVRAGRARWRRPCAARDRGRRSRRPTSGFRPAPRRWRATTSPDGSRQPARPPARPATRRTRRLGPGLPTTPGRPPRPPRLRWPARDRRRCRQERHRFVHRASGPAPAAGVGPEHQVRPVPRRAPVRGHVLAHRVAGQVRGPRVAADQRQGVDDGPVRRVVAAELQHLQQRDQPRR